MVNWETRNPIGANNAMKKNKLKFNQQVWIHAPLFQIHQLEFRVYENEQIGRNILSWRYLIL